MAEHFTGYGMPSVDFGFINQAVNTYDKSRQGAVRERVLSEIGQGKLDPAAASQKMFAAGLPEEGISLARLAESRGDRSESRALRQQQFEFQKQEAERNERFRRDQFDFQKAQADAQAKGFDVREVDDPANPGSKVLVRINRAEGTGANIPIQGAAPTVRPNPYATGPMKEHEAKAALFADRAATSHENINKFENINNQPGGAMGATVEGALGGKFPTAANVLVSGERGQMMNAKRAFVNALLRRESGAAINAGEFKSYDIEYFPQLGDTKEQIESKRLHRSEVISGLAREAGTAYRPKFTLDEKTGGIARTESKPGPEATPQPSGNVPQFKSPDEVARMVQTGKLKKGDTFRDPDGILRRVP